MSFGLLKTKAAVAFFAGDFGLQDPGMGFDGGAVLQDPPARMAKPCAKQWMPRYRR